MKINKDIEIQGKNLWETAPGPVKELIPLCRKLAAEGSVLLENNGVLPFKCGTKVAIFGRTQETYIKSGTGSGGLVRVEKAPCILDSFRENKDFIIDEELAKIYADWTRENPFDNGHGWATEPWSQKEMPLDDDLVKSVSKRNDVAVIVIGRTAGEDKDNSYTDGSYCLTTDELSMIEGIKLCFIILIVEINRW